MGKIPISNIKTGNALQKPFTFEVNCYGLQPTTPIPVKIYFAGNTQADGMLKLADGNQSVAKGVGIALVNDKGVKLPFSKDRSIKLDWQRSDPSAEVYRFSGNARYAPVGGEMKPGRGDATMSLVIDYN